MLAMTLMSAAAAQDGRILFEGKSEFNDYIAVAEDEGGLRTLTFERDGARQTVVKPGDPDHLELPYTMATMAALALAPSPRRVLVVGLGGGSIPMFLHKHYPEAEIDAVEIDPVVARVAREYLSFREGDKVHAHIADGRRFIEEARRPYDLIVLDAFGADNVPLHLTTLEFLRAVRRALTPDGVVAANVWSRRTNRDYDAMVRTYRDVFEGLCLVRATASGNFIFLARRTAARLSRQDLTRRAAAVAKEHGFRFDLGKIVSDGYKGTPKKDLRVQPLRDRAVAAPR
jgi:spermidine synthase